MLKKTPCKCCWPNQQFITILKRIEKVTKIKNRVRSYDKKERVVQPQAVIERIGELTNGDAIVVTDVGQHQMWTAQYYPYQNERQLVTSGGFRNHGIRNSSSNRG